MGLASLLSFFRLIVFGKFLEPSSLGYYSIVLTISSYGAFLQFGLMSGLNRELPVAFGKGKSTYSSNLVGVTTWGVFVFQTIGITTYFLILSFLSFEDALREKAFLLAGFLAMSNSMTQMVTLRLRSEQRVLSFSLLNFINSLLILLLGIFAIQIFNFSGIVYTIIFVNISTFIIVTKFYLGTVNYRSFNFAHIKYLVKIGLPMTMSSVLMSLIISMDRLFLIKYVDLKTLGLYQISLIPITLGIMLSSMIDQYIGPKLLYDFGKGISLDQIFKKLIRIFITVIFAGLFCWPLFLLILKYILLNFLPLYKDSIPLMHVFYWAGVIMIGNRFSVIFNIKNKQHFLLIQSIAILILTFITFILISSFSKPIEWYAYSTIFIQLINLITAIILSYKII